jgi:hypothetical protein
MSIIFKLFCLLETENWKLENCWRLRSWEKFYKPVYIRYRISFNHPPDQIVDEESFLFLHHSAPAYKLRRERIVTATGSRRPYGVFLYLVLS